MPKGMRKASPSPTKSPPPGGSWTSAPNGTYTINLASNAPTDLAGNAAATGSLGTFTAATTSVAGPVISSLSIATGPAKGGTSVIITGTNFTGVTAVKFGVVKATSFTVNSATQITAIAPAEAAAAVDVTVTAGGGTAISPTQYSYVGPLVSSISPDAGPLRVGTVVTITGSGFADVTAVKFGGRAAANFTVVSTTEIMATAPSAAGIVAITVATTSGTSPNSVNDEYTYQAVPTIGKVSPAVGPTTGGTTVVITGAGFANVATVLFGTTAASNFTINSATQITAVTAAEPAGPVAVTVSTPGGTSAASSGAKFAFVTPAVISSLSLTTGPAKGGTSVIIMGANFTGATAVMFGAVKASFKINSATQITAIAPAEAAATVNVTVTTGGGAAISPTQYTYVGPLVSSISPGAGPLRSGTVVTITGSGFADVTAVKFGARAAANFTVVSTTEIMATAPSAAGIVAITVVTPNGTSPPSVNAEFAYQAVPTVAKVSPAAGPTTGGTTVIITGAGFANVATVLFGTTAAASFIVNSPTKITAVTSAEIAGPVAVTVSTPGGTSAASSGAKFAFVTPPVISSLSLTTGPAKGGTSVVITGTNFTGATVVMFGAVKATSFKINSATQITAVAPAEAAATVNVTVITAGGTAISPMQYTYCVVQAKFWDCS